MSTWTITMSNNNIFNCIKHDIRQISGLNLYLSFKFFWVRCAHFLQLHSHFPVPTTAHRKSAFTTTELIQVSINRPTYYLACPDNNFYSRYNRRNTLCSFTALYTLNHKKTWHFIFDYNFG